MLDVLREKKNSSAIMIVTGLIIVVFIFWGSGASQSQRSQVVAYVNGAPITDVQYARAVGRELEQRRQRSRQTPSKLEEEQVRLEALNNLIEEELLRQEARRLKLPVSDYELREAITKNPYLQDKEGKFDLKMYKRVLKRNPSFESDMRDDLQVRKLLQLVMESVEVSDADLREAFEKQNTKVNLEYVKVDYDSFGKDIKPNDEERATFLKDHKEEVEARYERDFDKLYNLPRQVKASLIMMRVDPADTPETRTQIRAKLSEVKEKAKAGDFADLARQYSEDPATTAKGGDLGFISEKQADPAVVKVAFGLKAGELSDIVEIRQGLGIIKVEQVKDAEVKKLASVQNDIIDALIREQKGPELAKKVAEKVQAAWVKGGPELDALLKEQNLKIDETGSVGRTGDMIRGIGRSSDLVNTAFALRTGSPPPDKLFSVDDSYVLIRLKGREEANMADFEAKKESLRGMTQYEKQQKVVDAYKEQLKAHSDIATELTLARNADAT